MPPQTRSHQAVGDNVRFLIRRAEGPQQLLGEAPHGGLREARDSDVVV
jgi:hypothetical protein